jgi:hypothetical protein
LGKGDVIDVAALEAASYRPDGKSFGRVGSFDFDVENDRGASTTGSVQISIKRAPIVEAERTVTIDPGTIGVRPPVDPNGDEMTVTVTDVPMHGTLHDGSRVIAPGDRLRPEALGRLTFTVEPGFTGTAGSLDYLVEGGGGKTPGKVVVTIAPKSAAATGALALPSEAVAGSSEQTGHADEDAALWEALRDHGSAADIETILRLYPEFHFAAEAQKRRDELLNAGAGNTSPTASSEPAKVAARTFPDPSQIDAPGAENDLHREAIIAAAVPKLKPSRSAEPCADQVSAKEQDGIAAITVVAPCRAGAAIALSYRGDSYKARFDDTGQARALIALFDKTNVITYEDVTGKQKSIEVPFPGYDMAFKVAVLWTAAVRLDLHVIEPGSALRDGVSGHIYPANANVDLRNGLGRLNLVSDPESPGTHIAQYEVPRGRAKPGLFRIVVDFASRGRQPSGEYCEGGSLASPEFKVRVLDHGHVWSTNRAFGALPCGIVLEPYASGIRLDVTG